MQKLGKQKLGPQARIQRKKLAKPRTLSLQSEVAIGSAIKDYVFQCNRIAATDVADDLQAYCRGQYRKVQNGRRSSNTYAPPVMPGTQLKIRVNM